MEMIMMKKLFCIAVVVLMLCSFVLSTSALISPQETEHPTTPSATTPGNPDKTSPKTLPSTSGPHTSPMSDNTSYRR